MGWVGGVGREDMGIHPLVPMYLVLSECVSIYESHSQVPRYMVMHPHVPKHLAYVGMPFHIPEHLDIWGDISPQIPLRGYGDAHSYIHVHEYRAMHPHPCTETNAKAVS
jgi:hypothetical protein